MYTDGKFHAYYRSDKDVIDISYQNPFSRKFEVMLNETGPYPLEVSLDGKIDGAYSNLTHVDNDIVWKDFYGIFLWRFLLTAAISLLSCLMLRKKILSGEKRIAAFVLPHCLYLVSLLIVLRVFI